LLGQLAARFCRLCGARPVVVVDVADGRLERLPEGDPGIVFVNARQREAAEVVSGLTRGRLADVAF
jgi:threonine dehydrogenase-like Zn-dependent dehydrogenase